MTRSDLKSMAMNITIVMAAKGRMLMATKGFILPDLKCAPSMMLPITGSARELTILAIRMISAHLVSSAPSTEV